MKGNLQCQLIKSIEMCYSPVIIASSNTSSWSDGIGLSFNLELNCLSDNLWILAHFSHLKIERLNLYYRKVSKRNKYHKATQRKMRLKFESTKDLLVYLSTKPYKIDCFEIKFKNGITIANSFINQLVFVAKSIEDRNQLFNTVWDISGQGEVDISTLKLNQKYKCTMDGQLIPVNLF